jgi:uncharacterized repeat protein (TIGR01451 family)
MRELMTRLGRAGLATGMSGCLLLGVAGAASAATTIGQNGIAAADATCGRGNTFIQTGTAAGVPSYAAPAGGGIITAWSFFAGSTPGEQDKLKVVRGTATADQFFVVGEGALETMTPSALNTFLVRIPVQAGDRLGLYTADGNDCVSTHTPGNTDDFIGSADPAPGTTATGIPESSSGEAYNISARVEPDADGDGWGDETQDKCPGAAGPLQGCPKADVSITEVASAGSVLRGGTVTYTLTAKNNGPDAAPNVLVTAGLPSGARVVSATASSGSCVSGSNVSCDLGTLGSGVADSVRLVVRMTSIGPTAATATVSSPALVTAAHNVTGAGDTNPTNNSASTTTTVAGLANATESHRTWREPARPKLAIMSKKRPPVGTTFKFRLGAAAKVRFQFTQRLRGRKVHGRCVGLTKTNKHKPSCTWTVGRGSFSLAAHSGLNAVSFQGRVSASRKLKPGQYTVLITANTAGVGSMSARLTFTIVR